MAVQHSHSFVNQRKSSLSRQSSLEVKESLIGKKELKYLSFLNGSCRAFTFSSKIEKGQYVLPFSFKLPDNIPGTFYDCVVDGKSKQ